MKKFYALFSLILISFLVNAQIYRDGFTYNSSISNHAHNWSWNSATGYMVSHPNNSTVTLITGMMGQPNTDLEYSFYDNPQMVGIGPYTGGGNNIPNLNMNLPGADNVYVVVRSERGNPRLRLRIKDTLGHVSNAGLIQDIRQIDSINSVYIYSFRTPLDTISSGCSSMSPCSVQKSKIGSLLFSVEPDGIFNGVVVIDYIQIGGSIPNIPDVTITSPSNGAIVRNPFTISAISSLAPANIEYISFIENLNVLHTDSTSPYSFNWTNAALGAHSMICFIHNKQGIYNTSNIVNFTVAEPEINVKAGSTNLASGNSYSFGSLNVGSTAGPITFTIENLGGYPLSLSGNPIINISGPNASEFTINQTGTSAVVSASSNTTFTVTFVPSSAGSKTATLSILNDDLDEPNYTIHLTGTATTVSSIVMSSLDNNLTLYPNPVHDRIILSTSELEGKVNYAIKNELGAAILEGFSNVSSTFNEIEINTSNLNPGIYFLEITYGEKVTMKKIIKK
ncbi:MAG: choice-of-anchor D domain-containing protein [Cytophagaceae bacterium]|nr:choice-of-anchor D domain-containing protein [Cytophagaceae bacterium]MDW8457422.1 choice-of-anchor D domain-containing protein [Cytophagaceae bacterium]